MPRKAIAVSVIDEMVNCATSERPGQKRWFTRKIKQLPAEQQEQIWSILESKGISRTQEKKSTRTLIVWTEEEWNRLADSVWKARKNNPTTTLVVLTRRILQQFPEDRRRNIRIHSEIKPLIEKLKQIDEEHLKSSEENASLKTKFAQLKEAPTKEQILQSLTDEEVLVFATRILSLLSPDDILKNIPPETLLEYIPFGKIISHVIEIGVAKFQENQDNLALAVYDLADAVHSAKSQPGKPQVVVRPQEKYKPKVTIVGLLADQQRIVAKKLQGRCVFNFVDKNRKADIIPDSQDIVVLATKFISHQAQEQAKSRISGSSCKLVLHHGGIDRLHKVLHELLPN